MIERISDKDTYMRISDKDTYMNKIYTYIYSLGVQFSECIDEQPGFSTMIYTNVGEFLDKTMKAAFLDSLIFLPRRNLYLDFYGKKVNVHCTRFTVSLDYKTVQDRW